MAIKEVKTGEKYKLELLCIHNAGKVIMFETPTGDHLPFRESDLECVSPAAPKYDPCRKFREGDMVDVMEEMEPYSIDTCPYGYTVNKGEQMLATYNDETHPHAFRAACAERDRLNAEYRKEMEK